MKKLIIDYSKNSEKFFVKHENIREEFKRDVAKIINNDHPEQVNFKNLKGKFRGCSRISINGYRIIFKMKNGEIVVVSVLLAGSRGDIYKHI